jgi:hypothetical protein
MVHFNDLPHPLPRTSDGRAALEAPGVLLPGQAEVTLHSVEAHLRFVVSDAAQLQSGLDRLGPKSAVLIDATSALRHALQSIDVDSWLSETPSLRSPGACGGEAIGSW